MITVEIGFKRYVMILKEVDEEQRFECPECRQTNVLQKETTRTDIDAIGEPEEFEHQILCGDCMTHTTIVGHTEKIKF